MRRAKIVCTLGPASETLEQVRSLVEAGMDVARMNMSHGTYPEHAQRYFNIRRASDQVGRGVGVLADLQGPKIRLGTFENGPITLESGDPFTITTEDVPGNQEICSTTHKALPSDVHPGDQVLIDDGKISMRVRSVEGDRVHLETVEGGEVSNSKGINLPGVAVNVPALSEKDADDLRWALRTGCDMIALSFVRNAKDADDVRRIMDEEGHRLPIFAKIEKPQAVHNLEEIVQAFDGIMVARGDLGVELPLEHVPLVQKKAIHLCRRYGRPVIVATQMLESMISSSRPTRAEASDVANAVLDGTDAVMLSGETSVGVDPPNVVNTMSRIVAYVEDEALETLPPLDYEPRGSTARAVTRAAVDVGRGVGAKYIIAFTETGASARMIARHRPEIPLLAFTQNQSVRSVLSVVWGMETFLVPGVKHTDDMVQQVDTALLALGRVQPGDKVIIIAGVPPGVPGTTNGMRVHMVGVSGGV
jgi:pyruvate kinase